MPPRRGGGFWGVAGYKDFASDGASNRRGGVHERLRGSDAMFLQHHHEHQGVDDRARVKQFHAGNLIADGHTRHAEVEQRRQRGENG